MTTSRPPLGTVWWTHFAMGFFAGGVTGALSMLWFGLMSLIFDPDGGDGYGWLPLFSVFAGVIGAAIATVLALVIGTGLWASNRMDLGRRWYPLVGGAAALVTMWLWSSDLRLAGQMIVAGFAAGLGWRLTRATEETFSDYRS